MSYRPPTRIALLARHPALMQDVIRQYGLSLRSILMQEGTEALDLRPGEALLVDLRGWSLGQIAERLCWLIRAQRRSGVVPLLLVPRAACGIQRLVGATTALRAIILDSDASDTIFAWILAPLRLTRTQLWVNIPEPELLNPSFTEILAALTRAATFEQAAQEIALSPNAAYRMLQTALGLSRRPLRKRSVSRWRTLLSLRLHNADNALAALACHHAGTLPWLDQLARLLVGAELIDVTVDLQHTRLICNIPGEMHRRLLVEAQGAVDCASGDLIEHLSGWARTIDWVDSLDGDVCAIGLVGGRVVQIAGRRWQVEWVGREYTEKMSHQQSSRG